MSSLDNIRKSARRWLKALRANDPAARERLTRAVPRASGNPVLRDVQHALAREHGHPDWVTLRRALENRRTGADDITLFETLTEDFLLAYRTGDAAALKRLGDHFGQPVTWEALRDEVHGRLRRMPPDLRPGGDLTLDDVRRFAALSLGCETWKELVDTLKAGPAQTNRARIEVPRHRHEPRSGILHPIELRVTLPMELPGGVYGTTTQVWQMLVASRTGDEAAVRDLVHATPPLVRCEYNYMPPLHLAVREGHERIVGWLLEHGGCDPGYRTYPYGETLLTMAEDRAASAIAALLRSHAARPSAAPGTHKVHGAGHIDFPPDADRVRLEKLLGANAIRGVESLLDRRPDLVHDELVFWAEGILSMVANRRQRQLLELLLARGARVPDIAKWGRFYYFKHADIGALLLERGMNPNHMTWHRTTLLHDMAGEGDAEKAVLLLEYGADINAVDEEFRSTPLGFAARWGRHDMVRLLLDRGADPDAAAASWATPLAWADKKGHRAIAADLRAAGAR